MPLRIDLVARRTTPSIDRVRVVVGLALAAAAAVSCGGRVVVPGRRGGDTTARGPTVASNILRQDYAGSAACAPCHGDVVAAWRRSPMHRMTRLPEQTDVRAPFDGRAFNFKGDVARLEQVDGARFVRLTTRDSGTHLYRVTKVIGGRYREDFAGVEVSSTEAGAPSTIPPRAELLLPVSYVFQNASLRLKGYSVMVGERPGLRAGGVWNQTCIFCHNTVPYFDDLWGALHGPGAPGYQGEVVDRVLPPQRRLRYGISDARALLGAIDAEMRVLGAATAAPRGGAAGGVSGTEGGGPAATASGTASSEEARGQLRRAMQEARARFAPAHFVELGIGCESCHGGSREHVEDPRVHPTFEPRGSFLTVTAAPGQPPVSAAEWQNRACARCHQVLFSRYARTWEGGARRSASDAGGSHITSGEARDFLLGGCAGAMTCATCHNPHGEDSAESLARLATPAGNGVCTSCHRQFGSATALKAHAHHDPSGTGGACVACHMPRKNMGLGYGLTRYHRIGSPTDANRVERDRPLECALCHADRSVGMLLADMARLWGKHYDEQALLRLYGSLEANPLLSTIDKGYAHEQAAAMGAAGEQRFKPAVPAIAREASANGYPLVRYHAGAALAAIEGRPVPAQLGDDSVPHHHPGAAGAATGSDEARDDDD